MTILNLTPAQATALASLLGATGGNDNLDVVFDALVDRGVAYGLPVTFSVNDMHEEFPVTPEYVIHVGDNV